MAHVFSVDIPALPAPVGPIAQQLLQFHSAPAITRGDPIEPIVLAAASAELQVRQIALSMSYLTLDEFVAAEQRLHAVHQAVYEARRDAEQRGTLARTQALPQQREHVEQRDGPDDKEPHITGQFQRLEVQIAQLGREMEKQFQQIWQLVQPITLQVDRLRVDMIRLHNRDRQAFNRRRNENAGHHGLPLQPLLAVQAGVGPGIPGYPPVYAQAVQVGEEFPSPPFPTTINAAGRMTMAAIHLLATMMNDDFGIALGDPIHVCQWKVVRALTDPERRLLRAS